MSRMFFYFFTVLIMIASGCGDDTEKSDGSASADPSLSSLNLTKGISEVVKTGTDFYGVGYFTAKPVKSTEKGFVFKTYEVEVNVGAFGGGFIGNIMEASIEDDAVHRAFNELDRNVLYVFRYEYPHRLNPEIESTHTLIRSWEPLKSEISFESNGVESYREKKGPYSEGVRQGKVVQVERWGMWDIDCSVKIAMGGIRRERKSSENTITMNTYSEESCAFAEEALKAGVDISFLYSEDYVENWDKHPHILHIITTLKPEVLGGSNVDFL